jgi:hypothetical protein
MAARRLVPGLVLGGLLAVGLGLRLWGIGFAASTPVGRPDEEILAVGALHLFQHPYDRLDTGWPDLFFKLWHAVFWLEHQWHRLRTGGEVNMGCLVAINSIAAYLPIRILSALFGTVTAWVVGLLAKELAPERQRAALWGTALYAVNYLVGRDAHFGVSDALLCLEIALALLFCARAVNHNSWWLTLAAFVAGTAFSTKYSAVGLLFPLAAAAEILRPQPARPRAAIAWAAPAWVVGVLLWSPDILSHWSAFVAGFTGHASRYTALETPLGAIFYPLVVFPTAFGWVGLLLCLSGLILCLRARAGVMVAIYVVMVYGCLLGPLHAIFVRYGSPLVPALAAAGGVAAAALVERLSVQLPAIPSALVGAALGLVVLAPPAARLLAFDRLLARADTRDLAQDWLNAQGPDKVVWSEGVYGQVHAIAPSVAAVCRSELPAALWRPVPVILAPTAPQAPGPNEVQTTVNTRWLPIRLANQPATAGGGQAEWERIGFLGTQRFVIWEYDQRTVAGDLHAASAPDFLSRARGPRAIGWVVGGSPTPTERPLDPCWSPAAGFSPGDLERPTWDAVDGFLAPFDGFGALARPGPDVAIYRNRCKP